MMSPRLKQLFDFLQVAPTDSFTLYSIAFEYLTMEDFEQAIEYFNKIINLDPEYIGTYYHLGKTLERVGKLEEAIEVYKTGIPLAFKMKERNSHRELNEALNLALGLDDDF